MQGFHKTCGLNPSAQLRRYAMAGEDSGQPERLVSDPVSDKTGHQSGNVGRGRRKLCATARATSRFGPAMFAVLLCTTINACAPRSGSVPNIRPDSREPVIQAYAGLKDRAEKDAALINAHDEGLDAALAMQNAVLLGFRERELGIADEAGLRVAGRIMNRHPRPEFRMLVDIVEAVPYSSMVAANFPPVRSLANDRKAALLATFEVARSRTAFDAYVGLVLLCDLGANRKTADLTRDLRAALSRFQGNPALTYRVALCAYRLRLGAPDLEPQPLFDQAAAAGLAESRYFLGELNLRNGHLETAESLFRDVSNIEHWPAPWLGLAGIHMEFEEHVTALADLRLCLSSAPKQPETLMREAKVLTALGQYGVALDELSKLEATHEWSQIDVDLWRAKNLRLLQRLPEANERAAAARVMSGAYVGADLAKESGLVLLGLQQASDAATWLARAVALNEGDCEAWEDLGVAYDAMTSSTKAAQAFGRASICSAVAAERLRERATSPDDSGLTPARLMALRARLSGRAQVFDVLRFRAAFDAGRVFAALGKNDEALVWLRVAAQSPELRNAALEFLKRIGGD